MSTNLLGEFWGIFVFLLGVSRNTPNQTTSELSSSDLFIFLNRLSKSDYDYFVTFIIQSGVCVYVSLLYDQELARISDQSTIYYICIIDCVSKKRRKERK